MVEVKKTNKSWLHRFDSLPRWAAFLVPLALVFLLVGGLLFYSVNQGQDQDSYDFASEPLPIDGSLVGGLEEKASNEEEVLPVRAKAAYDAGLEYYNAADYEKAKESFEQALQYYQEVGDRAGISEAEFRLQITEEAIFDQEYNKSLVQ